MKTSYTILQELISWLEKFSDDHSKEPNDLKDFILWLNSLLFGESHIHSASIEEGILDMELTFLLVM